MNDHQHPEYADERHDHDPDYAAKYHYHRDLEREDERLKELLDQFREDLRELREVVDGALERIRVLENAQDRPAPADMPVTDECERGWHERCAAGVTCNCACACDCHPEETEETADE